MKAEEFLTREMFNVDGSYRIYDYLCTLNSPDHSGWKGAVSMIDNLLAEDMENRESEMMDVSYLMFGIFAEEIMKINNDTFLWLFHRFAAWFSENSKGKSEEYHTYPHLGMFEYLMSLK